MNKIGIHFGYWSRDRVSDFVPFIYKASALGFDLLELSAFALMECNKDKIEKIRRIGIDQNIELSFITGISEKYDISSDDSSVRTRGIEYLRNTIKLVSQVGSRRLSGILYGPWFAVPGQSGSIQEYRDRSAQSMKEVMKAADDFAVEINLEVVNRFEQFILNTSRQAVEYLDIVGNPNLRMLLDTFHLNIEENDIGEAIEYADTLLGHFHVCENNRRLPGDGNLNWNEVASALYKVRYAGPIVIESFLRTGGTIPSLLKIWRDMDRRDLDRAVIGSLKFLKECFDDNTIRKETHDPGIEVS